MTAGVSALLNVSDSLGGHHAVNVTADAQGPPVLAVVESNQHLYPTAIVLKIVSIDDTIPVSYTHLTLPTKRIV